MRVHPQGGKKSRKFGRNRTKCQRYRIQRRKEKNKLRRQQTHKHRVEKKLKKLEKRKLEILTIKQI